MNNEIGWQRRCDEIKDGKEIECLHYREYTRTYPQWSNIK